MAAKNRDRSRAARLKRKERDGGTLTDAELSWLIDYRASLSPQFRASKGERRDDEHKRAATTPPTAPAPVAPGAPAPRETKRRETIGTTPEAFMGVPPLLVEPELGEDGEPVELPEGAQPATMLDTPPEARVADPAKEAIFAAICTGIVRHAARLTAGDIASGLDREQMGEMLAQVGVELPEGDLDEVAANVVAAGYGPYALRFAQKYGIGTWSLPYEDEIVTCGGLAGSVLVILRHFQNAKKKPDAAAASVRDQVGAGDDVGGELVGAQDKATPASAWDELAGGGDSMPAKAADTASAVKWEDLA